MSIDDCYCCICHIFNKNIKPINVIISCFQNKKVCFISVYCIHTQSAYMWPIQHKLTVDWMQLWTFVSGVDMCRSIIWWMCFSHSWSGDSTSHAASVSRAKAVMSSYRSAPPHCSISSPWTAQTQRAHRPSRTRCLSEWYTKVILK